MKKFIGIFAAVFLLQYFYNAGSQQAYKIPEVVEIKHDNVILYATSWCGYCKKTRAFLAENNIEYIEYDIEKSDEAYQQHKALGGKGVPSIDIKGTVIHGYTVQGMTAVFKQLNLM